MGIPLVILGAWLTAYVPDWCEDWTQPLRGHRRVLGVAFLLVIPIFAVVSIIVWGIPDV